MSKRTLARVRSLVGGLAMAGAAWLIGCAPALACDATLVDMAPPPPILYDPFAGSAGMADMDIRIDFTDSADCDLALSITARIEGVDRTLIAPTGRTLRYIVETPDGLEYLNDAQQSLPLPPDPSVAARFAVRLRVPAGQMALAGNHDDQIRIRLIDRAAGGAPVGIVVDTVVRATVPGRAQINLAGSAGPFAAGAFGFAGLDFGEMATGAQRNAFVQVRATGPVTLTLSSQNGGVMQRIGAIGPATGMAYSLALDGTLLPLAEGIQRIGATPPATQEGQSYPLVVRLTGDPDALQAGEYRDVVTIEVIPD